MAMKYKALETMWQKANSEELNIVQVSTTYYRNLYKRTL